jgi:AcrR family transcriptional regulator
MKRTTAQETESALGLREKKKRAVRSELSLAAVRLAREHGLESVRTEDIVAAVGVSRRTFSNYFANKYEAIADRLVERAELGAEELRARPPSETLWQALTASVLAPYEGWANAFENVSAEERNNTRLLLEDPSLRAEILKGELAAQRALAKAVAERTRTAANDFYPSLVAAIVIAAIATAQNQWLRAKPPRSLVTMIREALRQVEQGLPQPRKRKKR